MAAPTDSIKINALTDGVTAVATDQIPVNRAGADRYITPGYIQTMIQAALVFQPLDSTLTALAAYNTNGLLVQTAADTFVGRTLAGTSNRLTVTNGDGVAGAPTFDIAATYVGQASITTLGTIATGTWQGALIGATYGGTGVNNGSNTLTLGGVTSITGGGALVLGGFTLTVPATGSAALLATANVFSAAQAITVENSATNATATLATFTHKNDGTGTVAANFGSRLLFNLDTNGGEDRNLAAIDVILLTAADASRANATVFYGVTAGGALAEHARITSTGLTITPSGAILTMVTRKAVEDGGAASLRFCEGYTGGEIRPGGTSIIKWTSTPTLGFFNIGPVAKQTGGENLTNNVTSGGTDGTIANYTDLVVYANDAAAIRNDIYQLARAVKQDHDALRAYGLLT